MNRLGNIRHKDFSDIKKIDYWIKDCKIDRNNIVNIETFDIYSDKEIIRVWYFQ